jgi:hypothetical protein|tara:strand:- start:2650 stop:3006 length:357 start_codon:yes stop_codon:yes gene_type:complete
MTDEQNDRYLEEDFLIRVRPLKRDDEFNGEASFSVISSDSSALSVDMKEDLEYVVKCMLSVVPLMEQDMEFRNFVAHYVDNYFVYEFDERTSSSQSLIKGIDGNVITINFNTDTEGSA